MLADTSSMKFAATPLFRNILKSDSPTHLELNTQKHMENFQPFYVCIRLLLAENRNTHRISR